MSHHIHLFWTKFRQNKKLDRLRRCHYPRVCLGCFPQDNNIKLLHLKAQSTVTYAFINHDCTPGVSTEQLATGCPRMFYTQNCKILRIFIAIKTIDFGILIYLSDREALLALWRILNQGNRPNKTENTWHYVKRVILCILIEVGKEGFMSYSA